MPDLLYRKDRCSMSRFALRCLRSSLLGGVALLLAGTPSLVAAASAPHAGRDAAVLYARPRAGLSRSGAVFAIRPSATCPTGHFLYADDGLDPNSISGYVINANCTLTPTPGSPYPTGGGQDVAALGANQIATSMANGPCVFHTDAFSGQVESFAAAATGALTEVSSILVGDHSTTFPGDIHVSADGHEVYLAVWGPPSYLDVLTVGSGCTLSLASTLENASAAYYAIALVNSGQLMAVDTQNSKIDIYKITNGTQLSLLTSTASQLASPDGAAAAVIGARSYVLNGMATAGPGEAEAHTINAQGVLGAVPGSPQTDPNSIDSASVFYDASHHQLIAGEMFSGSLGIYGAKAGAFAFLNQVVLPGRTGPTAMSELGSELYVLSTTGFVVDACVVASGSLTCALAAKLPFGGVPKGIGVL